MTDLVLTLLGPDRPGLVELVAGVIAAHGGNWLESRMSHLAGKFAGILRAELPPDKVQPALAALAALESRGLKVIAEPASAGDKSAARRAFIRSLEIDPNQPKVREFLDSLGRTP